MSVVLEAGEPRAKYLLQVEPSLIRNFQFFASAQNSVENIRQLILSLAVQGRVVEQRPDEESAISLLSAIATEKSALVKAGLLKHDKPFEVISDAELPYALPAGWKWVRLGGLLTKIGAGSTPLGGREVYKSAGIKFLRSQNIWNHGLSLEGVAFISEAVHRKMGGTKVNSGDLLFNITGASIGRCAVVPDNFDEGNVSQHVVIIRPALREIAKFLHLVLISSRVQQTVMDVQVGVSREGLSIAKLREFLVPIPPLALQRRIVARVEELMKLCDALEARGRLADEQHARLTSTLFDALAASESAHALAENWQRIAEHFDLLLDRPEAVDGLEQTILQLAVRGMLVPQVASDESGATLLKKIRAARAVREEKGDLKRLKAQDDVKFEEVLYEPPHGWAWCRLQDVYDVRDGTHDSPKFHANGIPLVTSKNIYSGKLDLADVKLISQQDHDAYSVRSNVSRGDILFAMIGSIGNPVIVDSDEVFSIKNVALFKYYARELSSPEFLLLVLQVASRQIKAESSGAVQSFVSLGKLRRHPLALPPLAEQIRIVTRVEELRHLCAQLRERLTTARRLQSQLAEALVAEVA